MTKAELQARIVDIVQDASFTGGILSYLNRGLLAIAGARLPDGRIMQLPALDTTDTVATTTDAAYAALPSDYMHSLYWVASAGQSARVGCLREYRNFHAFLNRWPDPSLDKTGDIQTASIKGGNLYYQPRAVDTLTLHYYAKPTALAEETDEPDCLPEHLHDALLVNYVCWQLFRLIEEEDKQPNADRYEREYLRALVELADFIDLRGEPHEIQDDADTLYV